MCSAHIVVVGTDIDGQLAKFQHAQAAHPDNPYFVCLDTLPLARAAYVAGRGWRRHVDGGVPAPAGQAGQQGLADALTATPAPATPIEIPAAEHQAFLAWVRLHYSQLLIAQGQAPDLRGEHKRGWLRIDAGGEITELVERTIVQGRWARWRVGGPPGAPGYFKLKPGGPAARADAAIKGAIDLEAMRAEAGAAGDVLFGTLACFVAGGRLYREYQALLERLPDDALLSHVVATPHI